MGARTRAIVVLTVLLVFVSPAVAHATGGDLYAAGTGYQASTYANHRSVFGGPEQWVADINANAGDAGRPIYAPEPGTVVVFSTGWGDGYGTSIIWTSADGREQIHVAHLSAIAKTGQMFGGDLIGYAGHTGNSTGDHMHVSRAYDGQPAPLVLSGQQIVPGYSGNGTQYRSSGAIGLSLSVSGVLEGMTYYCPVTVAYSCMGADAGTVLCDLDGAPMTSASVVTAPGTHRVTVSGSTGGQVCTKTLTFTIASPPAPGLEPVFRFYNPGNGTHFFTPSHAERDSVVQSWPGVFAYEGVAYFTNPAANTQPLYRFYNRRSASHFYTASLEEANAVIATYSDVFSFEGETYRVSTTPVQGSSPVYRFYNRRNGSHFYTASISEADTVIATWPDVYTFEGPAFWLAP